VGRRAAGLHAGGQQPSRLLEAEQALADRLVFARLRELLGGRLRFLVSGSAALAPEVAEVFRAADVSVIP
jgi:long-chain acyl-CoA synthetase